MVSFELFARPGIGFMGGADATDLPLLRAVSEDSLGHEADGKTHFMRVEGRVDDTGRWHVRRAGGQGSHQLTAMARADALALSPDGVSIEPGDEVEILPLR
jgi:molybdopterin biosynthesis enzyme